MSVTICSSGDYDIYIDYGDNVSAQRLAVVWGSSEDEVWSCSEGSAFEMKGDLKTRGPMQVEVRRNAADTLVDFIDSGGTSKSTIDGEGRWYAPSGVILTVESSCPTDSPPEGTTRLLSDTTNTEYALLGYKGGAWRKVALT